MKKGVTNQFALSILGCAALLLAVPAASADMQCKAYNDAYNYFEDNVHGSWHSNADLAKYRAPAYRLIYKAVYELDANKQNEVREVAREFRYNKTEAGLFPMAINQFCLTAGGDSPLRDAVLKTVHQYQERHRH